MAPKFDTIKGTTDAGSVKGGMGIMDPGEKVVDEGALDEAIEGGANGANIDITPIVNAIAGLQTELVSMKDQLSGNLQQLPGTLGSEVVTAMDKAGGG